MFCTYALDPGKTLSKMTDIVTDLGAEVHGGLCIKRTEIGKGAVNFAAMVAEQLRVSA